MTAPVASAFGRTTTIVRLKPDTTTVRLKPDATTAVRADLKVGLCEFRQGTPEDAPVIYDLISRNLEEGHLLPRSLSEITVHAHRFILAIDETPLKGRATKDEGNVGHPCVGHPFRGAPDERIVGCVDLAPLSRTVAEVRSLVVSGELRSNGVGRQLIDAVVARARRAGFEQLCAFTHAPSYFVQLGFSLVPHEWLPEKIRTDCGSCALFRRCNQYAVVLPLSRVHNACVPLASLHG